MKSTKKYFYPEKKASPSACMCLQAGPDDDVRPKGIYSISCMSMAVCLWLNLEGLLLSSTPGPIQTPCGVGPRGAGVGRPLLGLHPRPHYPPLDEVQRHRRHRVLLGGAGARLVRRHDQRQRVLPHVRGRADATAHRRYLLVTPCDASNMVSMVFFFFFFFLFFFFFFFKNPSAPLPAH